MLLCSPIYCVDEPIAQHLEEGVVVAILANIVEIIMFATSADALLTVHSTLQLRHWVRLADSAQEDGLELVHARVGEQQSRVIVGDDGRAGHNRVPSLLEVIEEGLADLSSRPLPLGRHGGCVQSCSLRKEAKGCRIARGKEELKHELGNI